MIVAIVGLTYMYTVRTKFKFFGPKPNDKDLSLLDKLEIQ